jgi:hypothetical protein
VRVFKYDLPLFDNVAIHMPLGAQVVKVGTQKGRPFVWALVDPDADIVPHRFALYGTGSDIPEGVEEHIGTLIMMGDDMVIHVFRADKQVDGGGA